MEKLLREWSAKGIEVRENLSLAEHSSFRIGGAADLAVFPGSEEELIEVLSACRERSIPFCVIGKASNVLFPDRGVRGVVVFTGNLRTLTRTGDGFRASCGVSLAALANAALEAGLSGCEFAQGIPGTVGGAVLMNAGAYGGEMAQIVQRTDCYDLRTNQRRTFSGEEQGFAYRQSTFSENPDLVILSAQILLHPADREEIAGRMQDCAAKRRASQPLSEPSAGSVFRRPEGHFAGKLIEDCGLKGASVGGAEVSRKHAGFIVNRGGATERDVLELIELIRRTVAQQTGVELTCEIRRVGDLMR